MITYNVHSCVGSDGLLSPERIADVLAEAAPDVVCLQELDLGRARTGGAYQAEVIAQRIGMQFVFHPAMQIGEAQYGDAILSCGALRVRRAALLPRGRSFLDFEPRGALWISTNIAQQEWQIINTHLGLRRGERRLQARALASPEWIGAAVQCGPLVVCGDLNSRPGSRVHQLLSGEVRDARHALGQPAARTFPARLPLICLDYIFVSRGVAVEEVRVLRTPLARLASDHLPLCAQLSAPAERAG